MGASIFLGTNSSCARWLSTNFLSSDIQKAFTSVFRDIEKLIDEQIRTAKEKGLSVKVGRHEPNSNVYSHSD
jgi:hypothetical protein